MSYARAKQALCCQGDGLVLMNPKAKEDLKIWASNDLALLLLNRRELSAYCHVADGSVEFLLLKLVKKCLPHYDALISNRLPLRNLIQQYSHIADLVVFRNMLHLLK